MNAEEMHESRTRCWCCDGPYEQRERATDPWEGRMDGYCYDCCLSRCDAYPGECHRTGDAAGYSKETR